ncbi:MAG: GNAT family N-acetyltransferase [Eubacteriales bacterium]|nr:GNAT family N-acetyltransferase [Eubacteriales bacterium]
MQFIDLETDTLYLRNISPQEREFVFEEFTDEKINQYLFDADPMKDIAEADELIEFYTCPEPKNQNRWVLVRKSDGEKLGTCGFHAWNRAERQIETGYELKETFRSQGYMQEAMTRILDFASRIPEIRTVDAHICEGNASSLRLAARLGFSDTGKTVNYSFHAAEYLHKIFRKQL